MTAPKWWRDPETREQYLPISDEHAMKVWRTPSGDYAVTCHADSFGFGGEVDYEPTLTAARLRAEALAGGLGWRDFAPEGSL